MTVIHDRTTQDIGNIVELGHVNVVIADQPTATAFYIMGLGLTRDPSMNVGLRAMWVNIGRGQFHLSSSRIRDGITISSQRLRGTIGLVLPDLQELAQRLEKVKPLLKDTQFGYEPHADRVEVTCPWGNHYRCHAPSVEFGNSELALAYVEFDVLRGTAAGIARFYHEVLRAPTAVEQRGGDAVACVNAGSSQKLMFHEKDVIPDYDGHHIQISIADFSGPHRMLRERGLITQENNAHQYRFNDIADPGSGKVLYTVEHEVRSLQHPMFGRELFNRNPAQTAKYVRGQDMFRGTY